MTQTLTSSPRMPATLAHEQRGLGEGQTARAHLDFEEPASFSVSRKLLVSRANFVTSTAKLVEELDHHKGILVFRERGQQLVL